MAETAAARQPEPASGENASSWAQVMRLPCDLTVDLHLPEFRIEELLSLDVQAVIDSHWPVANDVPLRVNGELIAWSEFEVVGNRLAVRVTELA